MEENGSFCVLPTKNIKYLIVSDKANTSIYSDLSLRKKNPELAEVTEQKSKP